MGEEKVTKKMMINCREASMLSILKDDKGLNIWQRIQLAYHSKMCAICKTFDEQSTLLNKLIKKAFNPDEIKHKMCEEKKATIQKNLDELSS